MQTIHVLKGQTARLEDGTTIYAVGGDCLIQSDGIVDVYAALEEVPAWPSPLQPAPPVERSPETMGSTRNEPPHMVSTQEGRETGMTLPNAIDLKLPFDVTLPEVNSLHIEFNGHMSSYLPIDEYYERSPEDRDDWVSEEERAQAIENNQVWHIQWYNVTPVGSYSILAATLESGLRAMQRIAIKVDAALELARKA